MIIKNYKKYNEIKHLHNKKKNCKRETTLKRVKRLQKKQTYSN